MDFKSAVISGFTRFLEVHTRSSRSEFWWWYLFTFLISVVAGIIDLGFLPGLVSVVLIVPTWTLFIRRLHDIGHSGWWVLLLLVPLANVVIWLYAGLRAGDSMGNRWG